MDSRKHLYFCVTTNLSYDQRMQRICSSLHKAGFAVTLVGRCTADLPPLPNAGYGQVRLNCFFPKGKLMYLEYNIRLFVFLMFRRIDCITAIDLDTIIPCFLISVLKGIPRIHDAHEWFSEMKEVVTRPRIRAIWRSVERFFLPRFPRGYTVSHSISRSFRELYGVDYAVVMNVPRTRKPLNDPAPGGFLLYQGAVNEGRCLEWLIPAMEQVDFPLWICGEGNFSAQARDLIQHHGLQHKVFMKGNLSPDDLYEVTRSAYAGINLVEPVGLNQIYSLANKFFDYVHAGIPQLTMRFPEYEFINGKYQVALLIDRPEVGIIAAELNNLLKNEVLYKTLRQNCARAASELCWEREEEKLVRLYMEILK